jgi:formate/nitrite transporter
MKLKREGDIMDHRMLTTPEVCEEAINIGIKKGAKTHFGQTLIAGILAGAFIALGGFAASMVSHSIENVGLAKFAAGAVFPVGLMLVLICGGELFTGNTLLILAFIEKKITLKQLLKNWSIVYLGNFIGAFIIALLIFNTGLLTTNSGKLGGYAIKVAATKGSLTFIKAFSSGILCNFLVCLAVWGSYTARDVASKVLIIWFPIMAFILSGFEHSIANMYYFTIGILAKLDPAFIEASHVASKISYVSVSHAIGNLVPVTLGNIIGGSVFVGLAYWAGYRYIPSLRSMEKQASNKDKVS